MRGRNFHTYSFERVLADIRDARDRGARSLFIVDDNITLNVRRFEALCQAIVDAGLNDLEYAVQATTSAIANHGERLARLMREAPRAILDTGFSDFRCPPEVLRSHFIDTGTGSVRRTINGSPVRITSASGMARRRTRANARRRSTWCRSAVTRRWR